MSDDQKNAPATPNSNGHTETAVPALDMPTGTSGLAGLHGLRRKPPAPPRIPTIGWLAEEWRRDHTGMHAVAYDCVEGLRHFGSELLALPLREFCLQACVYQSGSTTRRPDRQGARKWQAITCLHHYGRLRGLVPPYLQLLARKSDGRFVMRVHVGDQEHVVTAMSLARLDRKVERLIAPWPLDSSGPRVLTLRS